MDFLFDRTDTVALGLLRNADAQCNRVCYPGDTTISGTLCEVNPEGSTAAFCDATHSVVFTPERIDNPDARATVFYSFRTTVTISPAPLQPITVTLRTTTQRIIPARVSYQSGCDVSTPPPVITCSIVFTPESTSREVVVFVDERGAPNDSVIHRVVDASHPGVTLGESFVHVVQ